MAFLLAKKPLNSVPVWSLFGPCYNTHQYAYTIYISVLIKQDNLFMILSCIQDNIAIQVSMQVLDNIDTRERETRAFVKLNNFIPNAKCILITNSEEAVIDCDGINIEVIPIWKWLLDN